jgi:ABC-type transport system involved in multi-copper enzyme maturation permease subunit
MALLLTLARRSLLQGRFVVVGALVLTTGIQIVIVGQAAAIEQARGFSRMTELIPAFLQRGLGSKSLILATFQGTVAFGYFHPVVMLLVSVLAIYFATEPAHEVEAHLVDLTLARPVARHVVITRALLLGLVTVAVAAVLMFGGTQLGLRLFADPSYSRPSAGTAAQLLLNLAAVAMCFGAFALAVAAGASRWIIAFGTAAFTAVALYLIDFLAIGWPLMRAISWISPFHYYNALGIIAGDAALGRDLAILLSAAAVFVVIAYARFNRRDL